MSVKPFIKYTLTQRNKDVVFVECKAANLAQDFLSEDVGNLLIDLPNLIIAEKKYAESNSEVIRFRLSAKDKRVIEKKAVQAGYRSVSDYMRNLALLET